MNTINIFLAIFLLAAVHGAVRERVSRAADGRVWGRRLTLRTLALLASLGRRDSLRPTHTEPYVTAKGVQRRRLTQTYAGLDVDGASAEAELDMSGQLTGHMSGHLVRQLDKDIVRPKACQRDVSVMIDLAIASEGFAPGDSHIEKKNGRRLVYVDPDSSQGHLAYRVEFYYAGQDQVSFPVYYIDACDLQVLARFNQNQSVSLPKLRREELAGRNLADSINIKPPASSARHLRAQACPVDVAGVGGNPKTGRIVYNAPPRCLNVRRDGESCYMENDFVKVVDNQQSTTRFKRSPIKFNCSLGYRDPVNGAFGVASDAMFYGDVTGRLYVEQYRMRALPYVVRLVVHFGRCHDDASWNGRDMFFGDGCRTYFPLVSQDVIAHELSHGITTRNSNLEYRRESGGINEAFADISGEVAEVFGQSYNDWLVARELFKGDGALRYFAHPPHDGASIHHVSNYTDDMDVHLSSGIFNHAFYQLVTIQEMPIYDAYSCFLEANLIIWRSTTGFLEGACGVMKACYDQGYDTGKVASAFSVVGIDLSSCDLESLDTTVPLGSSRSNILVSSKRSPILKVDIGDTPSVVIATKADDHSKIQIHVSRDIGGVDVLTSGPNSVTIDKAGAHFVYVKLLSAASRDVKVTLSVT